MVVRLAANEDQVNILVQQDIVNLSGYQLVPIFLANDVQATGRLKVIRPDAVYLELEVLENVDENLGHRLRAEDSNAR